MIQHSLALRTKRVALDDEARLQSGSPGATPVARADTPALSRVTKPAPKSGRRACPTVHPRRIALHTGLFCTGQHPDPIRGENIDGLDGGYGAESSSVRGLLRPWRFPLLRLLR